MMRLAYVNKEADLQRAVQQWRWKRKAEKYRKELAEAIKKEC
jgi:hypothetical protein